MALSIWLCHVHLLDALWWPNVFANTRSLKVANSRSLSYLSFVSSLQKGPEMPCQFPQASLPTFAFLSPCTTRMFFTRKVDSFSARFFAFVITCKQSIDTQKTQKIKYLPMRLRVTVRFLRIYMEMGKKAQAENEWSNILPKFSQARKKPSPYRDLWSRMMHSKDPPEWNALFCALMTETRKHLILDVQHGA